MALRFYHESQIRATFIDLDGTVLVDSISDPKQMDNHLHRKEIHDAINNLYGFSIRHSDTIGKEYIYLAKKIKIDNKELFLRLAVSLERTNNEIFYFWLKILGFTVGVIIISLAVAFIINKKIIKELNIVLKQADDISNKKTPKKFDNYLIEEFQSISQTLIKSGEKLRNIDKEKNKYMSKIKLKNRQQKEMLSAMSHEFKNPIAIIRGYCETILEDDSISKDVEKKFLEKILNNSKKLNGMVDRFSLAIKLETGDFALKKTVFDLKEVTEEVIENLSSKYKNRTVITEIENINVEADRTLMEIVITNLIDNALKYSKENISVSLNKDYFSVKDNGIGIDKKDIDKITKKFYRIENLNWNNSMGLGLFIVSYILKLHNTELEITSKKDTGSNFFFNINNIEY